MQKLKSNFIYILFIIIHIAQINYSQPDTIKYPWPVPPFNTSRGLNATFGEFRNTGTSDHFHNAVDIGEPDGNPVYPVLDGIVYSKISNGYDSYINIKTTINGFKKHITYYHVVPSPNLVSGQTVIAGETILGTIYVGAAHVHLIDRELVDANAGALGVEINPVRANGGLNPYSDIYPPIIHESTLEFTRDQTLISLPSNKLNGKVDIIIKCEEQNGSSSSQKNNGAYLIGYRIWSNDKSEIVYEPDNNGIKYKFDRLPEDSYVHNVFVEGKATLSDPVYWLTNGNGSDRMNSDLIILNNYFDTDLLAEDNYLLQIFSEDTRGNYTEKYFPITIDKTPPELLAVIADEQNRINISWRDYNLPALKGYRLYYSDDHDPLNWKMAADENVLNNHSNFIQFNGGQEFIDPSDKKEFYFYLTAIDSSNNESKKSDIYTSSIVNSENHILIVDGFDRYGGNGSWPYSSHYFTTLYTDAIESNEQCRISSCSNDAVIEGAINLSEYNAVIWYVGDESRLDNTFINTEQYQCAIYLEVGGKLFVTGDDIGQDLDIFHSDSEISDTLFYRHYLKARLEHTGNTLLNEIIGEQNTLFEGINSGFGQIYAEDFPDDIEPVNGSSTILNYNYLRNDGINYRKGGIAYTGSFGSSAEIGKLVYFSFAFETIGSESNRNELMKRILQYFDLTTLVADKNPKLPAEYKLFNNYPNPFNPSTNIKFNIPEISNVKLEIFDVLGRKILVLLDREMKPGSYSLEFEGKALSSGVYFLVMQTGKYTNTIKMLLMK